ncbi:ABC transporter ATP-binding protein, partial [bacterium]|nr:ABC transporter ATP-binding protein [bacterium]
ALLTRPPLMILDEPTTGLDPEGKLEFLHLLRRLAHEERITIFISSHLLEEVEEICNRTAIIKEGRLLVCNDVQALLAEEERSYRVVTSDTDRAQALLRQQDWVREVVKDDGRLLVTVLPEHASRIAETLLAAGLPLRELSPQMKNLRTLFMELVHGASLTEHVED